MRLHNWHWRVDPRIRRRHKPLHRTRRQTCREESAAGSILGEALCQWGTTRLLAGVSPVRAWRRSWSFFAMPPRAVSSDQQIHADEQRQQGRWKRETNMLSPCEEVCESQSGANQDLALSEILIGVCVERESVD
eukprot:scaffold4196_cov245-Pinguiococcus_pyrenoidosus.AAC.1